MLRRRRFREGWGWQGQVRVAVRNLRTGHLEVVEFPNLILDAGKEALAGLLISESHLEIRYLAWGDGSAAPVGGNLLLGNELGRKQVTSQAAQAGVGVVLTTTYLAPQDANGQINELGWFAGPSATATPETGVLVARVLYSRLKNELESIQIDRTDTVS